MLVDNRLSKDAGDNFYRTEMDPSAAIQDAYNLLEDKDRLTEPQTVNVIRAQMLHIGRTAVSPTIAGEAGALVEALDPYHAINLEIVSQALKTPINIRELRQARERQSE